MTAQGTIVRVLIASPTDVANERRIARGEVQVWNTINASARKTVLLPVDWETDAMPEVGDRPQALINEQLGKNADLLIAIFWTRLGTPTGVAPSGTVEEIEEAINVSPNVETRPGGNV